MDSVSGVFLFVLFFHIFFKEFAHANRQSLPQTVYSFLTINSCAAMTLTIRCTWITDYSGLVLPEAH